MRLECKLWHQPPVRWHLITWLLRCRDHSRTSLTLFVRMPETESMRGIVVKDVEFKYPTSNEPFIKDCDVDLPRGSRCLLIGANGAGKTTLLQIVAGKYMVGQDMVRVLGRPPFHDMVRFHQFLFRVHPGQGLCMVVHPHALVWLKPTAPTSPQNMLSTPCSYLLQALTCSGQLSYLGTSWRKDVAFAGYGVALQVRPSPTSPSLSTSPQHHPCCTVACLKNISIGHTESA